MGGPGSGNTRRHSAKSTTSDYVSLDVRYCARKGMLTPGYVSTLRWLRNGEILASIQMHAEQDWVILTYRHGSAGGDWKNEEYPVQLAQTSCNLGGARTWFLCPVLGCGRRVAILYGRNIFACRQCHSLAYDSSREDAGDRAIRRADSLRARLGWEPGIFRGPGKKPKWMRWRTFERLTQEHDHFTERSMQEVDVRLGFEGLSRVGNTCLAPAR